MFTHLDLCSGIGGFHLAAEWAGFETIGFSEVEPYCCALLAEKWPDIKNYGNLRRADFDELRGRVDVLSAGVPCQPASLAGQRRGSSDDRWLWPAVLDVVESVRPTWAIFENPPGILSLDEFAGILLRLGEIGYAFRGFSVSANSVGAKHRRQRVFIVANVASRRWDRWRESNPARSQCNGGQIESERCGQTLAYPDRTRLEIDQSRDPGQCASLIGSCGPDRFGLTQPPLCRRTDGIPYRSHRLKALGNAVVPQQAYPFFEAIAKVRKREEFSFAETSELNEY